MDGILFLYERFVGAVRDVVVMVMNPVAMEAVAMDAVAMVHVVVTLMSGDPVVMENDVVAITDFSVATDHVFVVIVVAVVMVDDVISDGSVDD